MRLRTVLVWLLAVVVPLQCSAAVMRMAAGPLHWHAATAPSMSTPLTMPTMPALRDFRRELGPAPAAMDQASPAPALATLLHGHDHAQRHHHTRGDGSGAVVVTDGALERIDANDDGAGASSGAFGALLPLVGGVPAWQEPGAAHGTPASRAWAVSSRVPGMPERPPRG